MMRQAFHDLADHACSLLRGNEVLIAELAGEASDFCRFNRSKLRQAGSVTQARLRLQLIDAGRNAGVSLGLAGQPESDRARVREAIADLRAALPALPRDPHLLYATEPNSTEHCAANELPDSAATVASIADAAGAVDFVGIYAAGAIYRGFASSFGQRNWHETHSFNVDFSCYLHEDKAVKKSYAGERWQDGVFERRLDEARAELRALERPPRTVAPGRYRVHLAPAALRELTDLLAWDAFSARAHRTKQTPLLKMVEQDQRLAPGITIREQAVGGLAPNFDSAGFIRPDTVTLIDRGRYHDCLVSPRSAKEYDIDSNGANEQESPQSLELCGGTLANADVVAALGDGLLINNLWYVNFSDRNTCRMTGITRFACFVVDRGQISAPLNVMRFDDSLLRMLGANLDALTAETEWIASAGSYGQRSTDTTRLPGALIDDVVLTI